jgi:hypothetical protein
MDGFTCCPERERDSEKGQEGVFEEKEMHM